MSWQAVPPFPCWPHLPTNTTAGARFAGAFPRTRVPGTLWREKRVSCAGVTRETAIMPTNHAKGTEAKAARVLGQFTDTISRVGTHPFAVRGERAALSPLCFSACVLLV